MKISVIITVYNGQEYIREQLESLRAQTRRPDEVLIFDDKSNDDSVVIIREYIKENDLKNWKLCINKANKGWKRNFIEGFRIATGDIIFPCDQDDIWHKDKIERMSALIEQNDGIDVLAGIPNKYYERIDAKKGSVFAAIFDRLDKRKNENDESIYKPIFDVRFFERDPGCVLAIRSSFFRENDDETMPNFAHDAIIPYYAKLLDSYYIYNYEVIEWRRHIDSASNGSKMNRNKRTAELEYNIEMLKKVLSKANSHHVEKYKIEVLKRLIICNKLRLQLVHDKMWISGIKLIRYLDCYDRKRRFITDWMYTIKG